MTLHPQKPFAFQHGIGRFGIEHRTRKPIEGYSKNIKGICAYCAYGYQRIPKFTQVIENGVGRVIERPQYYCRHCARRGYGERKVRELPKELIPWKVQKTTNEYFHIAFLCSTCTERYHSFSIFGALCKHKTHIPPNAYVCRFCCTKDESDKEPATKYTGASRKFTVRQVVAQVNGVWDVRQEVVPQPGGDEAAQAQEAEAADRLERENIFHQEVNRYLEEERYLAELDGEGAPF